MAFTPLSHRSFLIERFGSIFSCHSPQSALCQQKLTEPFGRDAISGWIF